MAGRLASSFAFSLTIGTRVVSLTLALATSGALGAAIQVAVRRTIQICVCGAFARTCSVTIGLAGGQRGRASPLAGRIQLAAARDWRALGLAGNPRLDFTLSTGFDIDVSAGRNVFGLRSRYK